METLAKETKKIAQEKEVREAAQELIQSSESDSDAIRVVEISNARGEKKKIVLRLVNCD